MKLDTPKEAAKKAVQLVSDPFDSDEQEWEIGLVIIDTDITERVPAERRGDCEIKATQAVGHIRRALERLLEDREKEIRDDERKRVLDQHGIGF